MLITFLLVDDEPAMITLLGRLLRPFASVLDSADNLADAIRMARDGSYNVIVLDLRLRETDKAETLRAIPALKRTGASVMVVTGLSDPDLEHECKVAGADSFVHKHGDTFSRALLIGANIAVLHLPHDSFKSESFTQHVALLKQLAAA